MAYCYCSVHKVSWDDRKHAHCLECIELDERMELDALNGDANREMGLSDDEDWGNK